jgi:hypothetical protein
MNLDMFLKHVRKSAKIGHMKDFDPQKSLNHLPLVPPAPEIYESIELWKQESAARSAIAELKGIANIIPNQSILINAIVLQESQDSSEVENIITTKDKLYQAISASKAVDSETKEVGEQLDGAIDLVRKPHPVFTIHLPLEGN